MTEEETRSAPIPRPRPMLKLFTPAQGVKIGSPEYFACVRENLRRIEAHKTRVAEWQRDIQEGMNPLCQRLPAK